jgi:hypothetical protein
LNVHEFNSVGQIEIHTTVPLIHELNSLKVEIGIEMLNVLVKFRQSLSKQEVKGCILRSRDPILLRIRKNATGVEKSIIKKLIKLIKVKVVSVLN